MLEAIDRLNWLWNGALAELAGIKIEDLDLAIVGSELQIRGKRHTPSGKHWVVQRRERGARRR
jgi:HSP20 family molecular chaperone IbpA